MRYDFLVKGYKTKEDLTLQEYFLKAPSLVPITIGTKNIVILNQ
jgi:hypothetical protein